MNTALNVHPGELFPKRSQNLIYEFHGEKEGDRFLFICKSDSLTFRHRREQFQEMFTSQKGAIRVRIAPPEQVGSFVYTDNVPEPQA